MKFKRFNFNHKLKKKFINKECKKFIFVTLITSLWSKSIIFFFLNKFFSYWKPFFNIISIRNYCLDSGRSKNLKKQFWVSRISLRELNNTKLMGGLKKASW